MEMKVWFNYESLKQLLRNFFMTGITITEFDCLFEWVEPFLDTTTRPDSKDSKNSYHLRKQDKKTELACFSSICKHALHLGMMAWTHQQCEVLCWLVCVMTPLPGFVEKYTPKDFVEAGNSDTAVTGNATEFGSLSARIRRSIATWTWQQKPYFPTGHSQKPLKGMLSKKRSVTIWVNSNEKLFKMVDLTNSLLPSLKALTVFILLEENIL